MGSVRVRKPYDIISSTLYVPQTSLIFKSDKILSHNIIRENSRSKKIAFEMVLELKNDISLLGSGIRKLSGNI